MAHKLWFTAYLLCAAGAFYFAFAAIEPLDKLGDLLTWSFIWKALAAGLFSEAATEAYTKWEDRETPRGRGEPL